MGYIAKKGYPGLQALVAFSGWSTAPGVVYSEPMLNGFPESSTPDMAIWFTKGRGGL